MFNSMVIFYLVLDKTTIMFTSKLLSLLLIVCVGYASGKSQLIRPDTRIIGGINVTIEEYPYSVSMRIRMAHICGAVLISPSWVLTAAQCSGYTLSLTTFLIGTANRLDLTNGIPRTTIFKLVHPNYNSTMSDYDISAYQLGSPVTLGLKVKPISLPTLNLNIPSGLNTTISGWGSTVAGGALPTMLRAVSIPAMTNAECSVYYTTGITDRMVCAGLPAGGKDGCKGDAGGPLIAMINGVKTLIGISSWGSGCALPNKPGVYTRVPYLRTWIQTTTGV